MNQWYWNCFSKEKRGKVNTITFAEFENGLEEISRRKGTTKELIVNAVKSYGGTTYYGTKADYVKFLGYKSTYKGVYAKWGPLL